MHKTTLQEEIYKLKTSGNSIDAIDNGGETALHWAAARNDLEAVKLLLMNGADINKPSARGRRTLDQAASFCPNSECVALLLSCGARAELLENQGRSALCLACTNMSDTHAENVSFLLDHIDVALRDKTRRTALFHAVLWNNVAAMMILIDHGIDIDAQDYSGYTALTVAVHYNHHDAVKLLLDLKGDHTTVTTQSCSILHIAAYHSDHKMRQVLLDAKLQGIDVELQNKEGYTAEDLFLYQKSRPRSAAEVSRDLKRKDAEGC